MMQLKRIFAELFSWKLLTLSLTFFWVIPTSVLFITLGNKGYLSDSWKALWGEYTRFGLPYNPWRDFFPLFTISILASMFFAFLGLITRKTLDQIQTEGKKRGLLALFFVFLAAIAFESSIWQSLIFYWSFEDKLFGYGLPILPGLSTLIAFIIFLGSSRWLFPKDESFDM